jgi:peptide deformylase
MSILKVARLGHPVLRERARKVDPAEIATPEFQKLIDDMFETLDAYDGIGLAAPQVHESVRLVLVGIHESRDDDSEEGQGEAEDRDLESAGNDEAGDGEETLTVYALINPEITPIGREKGEDWEGCLSLPGLRGRVRRPNEVMLVALDREGNRIEMHLHGYPARVLQHEADHLDGVLFIDRMSSFETLTFLEEYGKYWARAASDDRT